MSNPPIEQVLTFLIYFMRLSAKEFASQWYQVLRTTLPDQRAAASHAFLTVLYEAGAFQKLSAIVRWIDAFEQRDAESIPVVVRTAFPTDQAQLVQQIRELLQTDRLSVRQVTDPAVLGGLVVETPNQRWDLSVAGQLHQLASSMN